MAILAAKALSFAYPGSTAQALTDITLTVEEGTFLVLCGASGSGKSTLLRHCKSDLAPHGTRTGMILFDGRPLEETDRRTQAGRIGYVAQSPEHQIVTDKVWHELAFGLESLGYPTAEIRGRVAEMAAFFGIESWFHSSVTALSGGQKQLLNLAAVMTLHPDVLLLDEPTSMLDPIAAAEFLNVLKKVNTELGVAVILSEHRLEEALPLADSVAVMAHGRLLCQGTPREIGSILHAQKSPMFAAMPAPMQIWAAAGGEGECPLTVSEGRTWLKMHAAAHPLNKVPERPAPPCSGEVVIRLSEVWFRYAQEEPDVLRSLDLTVHKGEFLAILGGNGAGKSTTLGVLSGRHAPYRGEVRITGTVAALPQDPQALFVKKTVREDLLDIPLPPAVRESRLAWVTALCRLEGLLGRHPYDLSGGEQQRAALARVLMTDADILLLDEPTKGFDAACKQMLGGILRTLTATGKTLVMVSHDVSFCAEYAHRCALFFDGSIVTDGTPQAFFSGNSFYTTPAARMAAGLLPGAVTASDVATACGGTLARPEEAPILPELIPAPEPEAKPQAALPLWRKILAGLAGAVTAGLFLYAAKVTDLTQSVTAHGVTALGREQLWLYGGLLAAVLVLALSLRRPARKESPPQRGRKLTRRTAFSAALVLMVLPLTLFVGVYYLGIRQYYVISAAVLIECMLPFFLLFEGRRPQARELATIATLCAIGIAGRAAFFMLPHCKPVAAVTIVAGAALGGEAGFLVGALTMLASNVLFAQGPWTPFQMFAMGMLGFLAGVLCRKGLLRRERAPLCLFGAFTVVVVYGGLMNPAAALIWGGETLNRQMLLSCYVTGVPMDLIHAAATVAFLWFGAEPMLEKIERVREKYGILDG